MALKLQTIICSTRPSRVGPVIAQWFHEQATEHGKFETQLVDLAAFKLPVFDEPEHPRLQNYRHEHTKAWSASVASADAYVFVTPEYNYNPPPSFVNAVNYLVKEWGYKPAGFVSYGGVSGGLRAAQAAKLLVTSVKMMPMSEGVGIPNFPQFMDDSQNFRPNDLVVASVKPMLDEMHRWAEALKPLRG
jgi:NAD(P)H-dependent FMN reductase